ncbi:hypothetical protein ACWIUD_11415 [Helicobacter sp. 23-1044]
MRQSKRAINIFVAQNAWDKNGLDSAAHFVIARQCERSEHNEAIQKTDSAKRLKTQNLAQKSHKKSQNLAQKKHKLY